MELDHNSHSVFLVYYHLVMVIKYRRKVRNGKISERAKEIFEYIAPGYGILLEEWNHDTDHVHVLFRAQPKTELRKFINACKSASSRLLKLLSAPCRRGAIETIRQYIESQGEQNEPRRKNKDLSR